MEKMTYQWISTSQQLAEICSYARKQPVVALDTEFIRTRTFYSKLGLIQLYDGVNVCLIDPLNIDDFSPFIALLADQKVLKVFHACSEDLDLFFHTFNQLPTPMLDTQIMAAFVGTGISLGFAKLVHAYLDVELDKGASRTDWLARPLTETQLQYAVADVWYLLPVYHKLAEQLAQTPWQTAVKEECQYLLDKTARPTNKETAYKEIGNAWQLQPAQLAVLQLLAKWRVEEAEKRDLALNFLVKEQSLYEIAKTMPKHTSALLEFMHPNEVRIHGKKLLLLVEQGRAVPVENQPPKIERLIEIAGYKTTLKALQKMLDSIQPEGLAVELIASKRQLNQLFKWHNKGRQGNLPELLSGWRKPFGEQLLACFEE